jgi:hypothetical protein
VYKWKSRQVLVGGSLEGSKSETRVNERGCQSERESRPGRVLRWLGGAAQLSSQRRSSCFVFRCLERACSGLASVNAIVSTVLV